MNFAALPPEVNSGRMYAGPGSGPMLAAASAWAGLAADLHSTATAYQSVVSGLTSESWLGPSSAAMAAATAPYVAWMSATAGQAEQAATQAKAAAVAYETAFAMTVPPPVIAANRAQLVALVATNVLGQNTPAIAATEAHYGEMWAQDAAAMYGYAASSAGASRLTPFTAPPHSSNPAGLAGQGASVTAANGTSAATNAQPLLSQLPSGVPAALQGLAAQAEAGPILNIENLLGLSPFAAGTSALGAGLAGAAWWDAALDSEEILATQSEITDVQQSVLNAISQLGAPGSAAPATLVAGGTHAPALAGIGRAVSVGGLSVPSSWAAAAPEIRAVGYALSATSVGAAPAVSVGSAGTAFSQMALAGMGGSALAGTVSRGRGERVGATTRVRVESPASPVTGIAAELREFAALRDSGILTDEEFDEQKRRLLLVEPAFFAGRSVAKPIRHQTL